HANGTRIGRIFKRGFARIYFWVMQVSRGRLSVIKWHRAVKGSLERPFAVRKTIGGIVPKKYPGSLSGLKAQLFPVRETTWVETVRPL
ncbi:MAG: hypothetical protein JJU35_14435, partial [Balneolales bacterium]|nr:hypothetical protein [Balneolales bacterium]